MKERKFKDELTGDWYMVGKIALPFFVLVLLMFIIWGKWFIQGGVECFVLRILHLYCPGCGGTRSFYNLIHGRILQSILMNPFVPYCVLLYPVFMVNTFLCKHTKKLGFDQFPISILIYASVGILMGQWVIRNILYLGFHLTVL